MKKQTKNDRLDESLGMRRGKESTKNQSFDILLMAKARGFSKRLRA